jgi:hypothetical protein
MSDRTPKRTEEDLRAAFTLAAHDAPTAEDVLARFTAAQSPNRARGRTVAPRRSWVSRHGPLVAAAVVLLAIAIPLTVWPPFGGDSQQASSNSAGFHTAKGAEADASSSPAAGIPVSGMGSVDTAPQAPTYPSAGPVCTPAEVLLTLTWAADGEKLIGKLVAKNITTQACDLLVKPGITPLGTDGQPLGVSNPMTEEQQIGPSRLLPGATATSALTWNLWCGPSASKQVRVDWGTGDTTVTVTGPTNATCPSATDAVAATITSGWFSPLS